MPRPLPRARAAAEGGEIGSAEAEADEESAGKESEESKEGEGKEGEDGKERTRRARAMGKPMLALSL